MLMPMMAGIASTKAELTSWLHEKGLEALNALLHGEAEALVGKKGSIERSGHITAGAERGAVELWRATRPNRATTYSLEEREGGFASELRCFSRTGPAPEERNESDPVGGVDPGLRSHQGLSRDGGTAPSSSKQSVR